MEDRLTSPDEEDLDPQVLAAEIRQRIELALSDATIELLASASLGTLERLRPYALELAAAQMQGEIRDNTDDLQRKAEAVREAATKLPLTAPYQAMVADIAATALRPRRYDEQKRGRRNARAAR